MRVLFFHAGPGLNSHAEAVGLTALVEAVGHELRPWNEPSRRRADGPAFTPDSAFASLLASAERFLQSEGGARPAAVVGHSFGAHVVRHLVTKFPARVAHAVYVCPSLSLPHVDRNILGIARRDFAAHGDERAQKLDAIIERATGRFDENAVAGFELAASNPRLFDSYWHDRERRAEFFRVNAAPEHGLDAESFFAVRATLVEGEPSESPVPATCVLGAHDLVTTRDAELALLRRGHRSLAVETFEGSGHYAHLEEPRRFIDVLGAALAGS